MATRKHFFTMVLLALIAFKVSSAAIHQHLHHGHDEEHEDHEESCELCEQAFYYQNTELATPPSPPEIGIATIATPFLFEEEYSSVILTAEVDDILFGRPPPSVSHSI